MSRSMVSFASWFTISLPSMAQWLDTQQKRTHVPLLFSAQGRFIIWHVRGFSVSSPSIACKQDIWVRVEYNTVLYRIHVPIIVHYQGNGCSLSSKDGAVIRESLGQLAACRLTILKMAVDDHCRPHPLTLMAAEGMLILHVSLLRWYGGCWQNGDDKITPTCSDWIQNHWPTACVLAVGKGQCCLQNTIHVRYQQWKTTWDSQCMANHLPTLLGCGHSPHFQASPLLHNKSTGQHAVGIEPQHKVSVGK